MGHDATKVLLASTQSSSKQGSEDFASSPITFPAGTAVRRTTGSLLSVVKAAGEWIGISLGKSLSDTLKTTVLRAGERVPLLVECTPARGVVTITSFANLIDGTDDTLKVGATTFLFKASGSGAEDVVTETSDEVTATNLAAKINGHATAGPLFKAVAVGDTVTITAKNNATAGADIDLVYSDEGTSTIGLTVDDVTFTGGADVAADFVTIGAKVYISDTTGKADDADSLSTISDAVYVSGVLTGINEAGEEVACVLVDMPGGL